MIKRNVAFRNLNKRFLSSILAFLTIAALFLPAVTMWTPSVNALPNNTEYIPDDTYLSGSDFSDLALGVIAKGGNYSHTVNGNQIYQIIPKNSQVRVMEEDGNRFLRYERSTNSSSNDVYIDVYDTQKDIYTGDFVSEFSVRLMDYPKEVGNLNLIQFINRDKGNSAITGSVNKDGTPNDNIFQNIMSMSGDGSVRYRKFNASNGKEGDVDSGYDMVIGEWTHFCVVMHRNETERDTIDVYINGQLIVENSPLINPINSIWQLRVCQTAGGTAVAHTVDVDNVWLYKGSAPAFTVGSGAPVESVVGALDYSDSALAVGATVKGKITTARFEIDAKNDLFSVHKDTWRTLLKMDQSKGSPYVDVYANGVSGSLVADMAIVLGDDWNGNAELLSPFTASGDYVSRETFLRINAARQLTDGNGNVLAELGRGMNRIALSLSADRGYASVFVNGKLVCTLETESGNAYKKLGGIRFFEFTDTVDAGTVYLYFADIYRGSVPAIALGDSKLEYRNDFDYFDKVSELAPITFVGNAGDIEYYEDDCYVLGYFETATVGSSVRYAAPLSTTAVSLSFTLSVCTANALDVIRFGDTPILSLNESDGRLSLNTADGAIQLFKTEAEREYQVVLIVKNGGVSLYIDGIPFVPYASAPNGIPATAEHVDFLYAKKDGRCTAFIDSLEIYTGGSPFVSGAQIPIIPTITTANHNAQLTWSAIGTADGYRVYRSNSADGQFTDVSGLVTENSYTDGTVISGMKYFYRVAAVFIRSGEEFVLGLEAEPTVFEDIDPALGVKAVGVAGGVKLTWSAFHSANLGYSVYRSYEENEGYELIAEAISALEFVDQDTFPGLVTYYKVCVIIERDGQPYVFGLDQKPIEASAGIQEDDGDEPEDPNDTPTDGPTDDPEDGNNELKPMDPVDGGVNIPESTVEKLFETNFESALEEINGITANGSGFTTVSTPDNGMALSLSANSFNESRYISAMLNPPAAFSIIIDLKICVNSATNTVYLIAPCEDDSVLFNTLELKSDGTTVTLYMGLGVGGETKTLATFNTAEWHRVTVWFASTGDKVALFLDGTCIVSDAALPMGESDISAMKSMRFIGVDPVSIASGIDTSDAVDIMMDDLTVRNVNVFANASNSAILTPKVSVSANMNTVSWKAANGAMYYTLWRSDENGTYTVIATDLTATEFVDNYDKDCSYKVTYTYGTTGVELVSLSSSTGVSAKKPAAQVIVDTVTKFIDLSNPGTLGILIVTALSLVAIVAVYVVRTFVLKVDPAQPNRIKKD